MRVRQSYLGTADDCLRKLQYQIESPVRNSGSVRAVGTAYHAGLEGLYEARMVGQELGGVSMRSALPLDDMIERGRDAFNTELDGAGDSFIWDPDKFPSIEEAHDGIERLLSTFVAGDYEWPEDWTVLAVEHSFEMEWMGHLRTGTVDLVMLDPNGWVVVEDHKTAGKRWPKGKEHPRKNNQAPWYIPMVERDFPGAHGYRFVFGVMTYKGEFERRISDPTPEHVAAIETKALQVATLYEGMRLGAGMELPANPASTLCNPKWCDFFDICPHGRILDA